MSEDEQLISVKCGYCGTENETDSHRSSFTCKKCKNLRCMHCGAYNNQGDACSGLVQEGLWECRICLTPYNDPYGKYGVPRTHQELDREQKLVWLVIAGIVAGLWFLVRH